MNKKAISACLCGVKCRYDNTASKNYDNNNMILICPEVMGGLSTPRNPIEIVGEVVTNSYDDLKSGLIKVLDKKGNDYSKEFLDGAHKCLEIIKKNKVKQVILKCNSPSCGIGIIYDGTFTSKKIEGYGILAALLIKNGIEVISE